MVGPTTTVENTVGQVDQILELSLIGRYMLCQPVLIEFIFRLNDFDTSEADKAKWEHAQNALEAFVYEMGDKLEQAEYIDMSTEEEREEILKELNAVREWMDGEAGPDTKTEEFEDKLKTLKTATKDLFYRRDQARVSYSALIVTFLQR